MLFKIDSMKFEFQKSVFFPLIYRLCQVRIEFSEAVRLSTKEGVVNQQVLDAIRFELAEAKAQAASSPRLHMAQTVLGMALLLKGNQIMDPMYFCPFYLESEQSFLDALRHPDFKWAQSSLDSVRRMLTNRPKMDLGEPHTPALPRGIPALHTADSVTSTRLGQNYSRVAVLVLACCRPEYLDRCLYTYS